MKSIKLNKEKLNELWCDGGRKTSYWCNYYLTEEKDGIKYLVEKANWKAYIVYLLCIPLIVFVLIIAGLYKILEFILNKLNLTINPVAYAHQSLFTKERVRKDLVRDVELFKNF